MKTYPTYVHPLSPRELEVEPLILEGLSIKAIASELGTAEGNVKRYVSSILHKRGARNRMELLCRVAAEQAAA